jgi:hypothetical protein
VLVVAVALVIGKLQQGGGGRRATLTSSVANDRPPPSREEKAQALGAPAPVPPGTGRFEVLHYQRNDPATPVAFDPCRPIHYVLNLNGAPSDGAALILDGITRVQAATGLRFVSDGTTTEAPSKDRVPYQPSRYGRRWAPMLIGWSDENAFPELAGYIAGVGAPSPVYGANGQLVYVTGEVVLDGPQLSPASTPDRGVVRAIILHELGHLMGLDHTSDRGQIMFSESQFNVRDYGDGDLRGLAKLGTQVCFPET